MTEETQNEDITIYVKQDELPWETINGPDIDYTSYKNGGDLLTILEDDGTRWATAFAQFYKQKYDVDINVEFAFVWFANAIEGGHAVKVEREKKTAESVAEEAKAD